MTDKGLAIVTGVGPGLGTALARRFAADGYLVWAISRSGGPSDAAPEPSRTDTETGSKGDAIQHVVGDVTDGTSIGRIVEQAREQAGPARILIHNAARFLHAPFLDIAPADFEAVWRVTCEGAFHAAQAVLPDMEREGHGTIIFTGATAALRGGSGFAAFASAKFALRGLAQSLAREFGPKGIHVAHVNIDGLIWGRSAQRFAAARETCLEPDAIAELYANIAAQPRSAWTHELDVRPFSEKF